MAPRQDAQDLVASVGVGARGSIRDVEREGRQRSPLRRDPAPDRVPGARDLDAQIGHDGRDREDHGAAERPDEAPPEGLEVQLARASANQFV